MSGSGVCGGVTGAGVSGGGVRGGGGFSVSGGALSVPGGGGSLSVPGGGGFLYVSAGPTSARAHTGSRKFGSMNSDCMSAWC
jgi:hypothetical protein